MSYRIITIGRQYGSGGREIGEKLAKALGIGYYDQKLIEMAASNGGLDLSLLKSVDEKKPNTMFYYAAYEGKDINSYALPINDRLFLLQNQLIQQLASKESCVIVGRCADAALAEYDNVFNVFIYAERESRVQRVMARNNISAKEAVARIKKIDKQRSSYYNFFTDKRWGKMESYDLMMDSSKLGVEQCVNILTSVYKHEDIKA